jgi:hypothetical protein
MSSDVSTEFDPDRPTVYQIRIKGHLGPQWTDWFEGLAITLDESGDTLVTGPVTDQAALHGLLRKVRDLGMPLVSVRPIRQDVSDAVEEGAARDALGGRLSST